MICEWLLTNCTKMGIDICTWRTRTGHFHLFSKSTRIRNKKLLGIIPLTLLCTTWAIVAVNLFACRQMNEVNEVCSPAHNKTKDTRITPQLVNVTLGGKTAVLQNNINYHFNGTFYRNLEFRHGGLRITWGHTANPNSYREQPPYTSYLDCKLLKAGDIQIIPGPSENDCHVCNKEVDTQHGPKCDTCDVWLHPNCVNFNQQELCAFETYNIFFMI